MLSRDIRSVTQRIKVPQRAQQGGPAALSGGSSGGVQRRGGGGAGARRRQQEDGGEEQQQQQQEEEEEEEGFWKVVLDGIEISYDVEGGSGDVWLRGAKVVPAG